ncbi:hypothetical protein MMYC01_205192 [Madurella mycetomatis]|uniref:Uncharacterized protein n=1 Tax=Madurella mycetomatis TaxID=100816 RepID=A0A175WCS8_9PEZI|nr:hypothetical protein MMYC01_205192 [Madurella mycetomatis]
MPSKKWVLRKLYFRQCSVYRFGILEVLMHFIVRVRGDNRLVRVSYKNYKISAIVYRTGFGLFRTLVFQDRDNNLDGISERTAVNSARHTFSQLDATLRPLNGSHDSIGTKITWVYVVGNGVELDHESSSIDLYIYERVQLRSMSNVISVIVPLLFASPILVLHIQSSIEVVIKRELYPGPNNRSGNTQQAYPPIEYTASFYLDTREHRAMQGICGEKDSTSLSNSLIRRNGLLSGTAITRIGRTKTWTGDCSDSEELYRTAEKVKDNLSQIKKTGRS